jgi:DNA invertase Pin-like site-specific DNA recombinase
MVYGYCRCSTRKQKIDRQIENILRQYPTVNIVCDYFTGRSLDRPNWRSLYKKLKKGDIVVFDEVSRMSRNEVDGFELYQELYTKGVELRFLKESYIDSTVYAKVLEETIQTTGTAVDYIIEGINKYLMALAKEQIRLAFKRSQQEVDLLSTRTKEGIREAHLKGSMSGHKEGTTYATKKGIRCKEIIRKHSLDFGGSLKDIDVIKLCGCARGSYYKYKRDLLTHSIVRR